MGLAQLPPDVVPADELHVLVIIDNLGLGGAELMLAHFASAAGHAGVRLSVASLKKVESDFAERRLQAVGVTPVILEAPQRLGPGALRVVRRHVESVRPDLVHTHLGASDVLGALAARSLGIPAVSTIHSVVGNGWDRRDRARLELTARVRRHCADRIIAVSESARRAYLARGWDREARVATIHNGIAVSPEPGSGGAVRRELGLDAGDFVVGMVSALRLEKAHDVAIEAVGLLRSEFPELRLLVVGAGPAEESITRLAEPLGEAFVLAGARREVMPVFDAMDVCLHPSRTDAFPTTLLEAMAASVPVVASAVGGVPEIVEDGREGILVPAPPTAVAVAGAIRTLIPDLRRRDELAHAGRRRYEASFTADVFAARTRVLYKSVVAQRAKRR